MMKSLLKSLLVVFGTLVPWSLAISSPVVADNETDSTWYPFGMGGSNGLPLFWTDSFSTINNVLYNLAPSSTVGDFTQEGAGGISQLTNGISELTGNHATNLPHLATVGGTGTQAIFTLAAPIQLQSIVYYGGWTNNGQSDALFDVSYSTDNGANWTLILDPNAPTYTVVDDPTRQGLTTVGTGGYNASETFAKWIGGDGMVTNMITITDDFGMISNGATITDLKFDFYGGRNGYNGLMNLAAFAAVPEPVGRSRWS